MKPFPFSLGLVATLLLSTAPLAVAALKVDPQVVEVKQPDLTVAENPDNPDEVALPRAKDPNTGYFIVNPDTWMTEEDIPWSTVVVIRGENQADYLAVPDRSYESGPGANIRNPGVASLWSRHSLELYGYGVKQVCLFGFICSTQHPVFPATAASLKIDNQVFHLEGQINQFKLSEATAWALKTAGNKEIWLRVAIAGGSNYTTRPIGPDTVKALTTLYQDVDPPAVGTAAMEPVSRLPNQLPAGLAKVEENDWRRQSGVVWSEPVIVKDSFEGDYLAVLDRSYSEDILSTNSGIITNWSAHQLAIHLYQQDGSKYVCWAVDQLVLKIGQQTFELYGKNNLFPIPDDLAKVLAGQPQQTPVISYTSSNGKELINREIGPGTVASWQVIYGSTKPAP